MKYLALCIFIPCFMNAMDRPNNNEIKQKIAAAVSQHLLRKTNESVYKQQPYLAQMLQSSFEIALLQSPLQFSRDKKRAELDYEFQRFCVTTENPHVLTVYNLARENVSEK